MTNSDLKRDSAVMISSTMPSAKYSCSGSPDMFWNGRTAIDGLSGSGSVGGSSAPTLPSPACGGGEFGEAPSPASEGGLGKRCAPPTPSPACGGGLGGGLLGPMR